MDKIRSEVDTDDIRFGHKPTDTTPNVQAEPEPTFDFADFFLKGTIRTNIGRQKKSERNT